MNRILALCCVLAIGVAAAFHAAVPARAAGGGLTVTGVVPDTGLQQMFDHYGDTGGGWTGADSTYSAALPDGRDAWLFSDTFLGKVNADHSRPADAPFIHNSMVVQAGQELRTVTGGTPAHPESLFGPTPTTSPTDPSGANQWWYWSGDGIAERDHLRVFALKFVATGTGQWDFRWDSTAIASFHLPDMTPEGITPTYGAGGVTWGSWIVRDRGATYVYGIEDLGGHKYAHLARASDGLLGTWQFWTGSGWSADPAASTQLLDGVANEYSVTRVGNKWALLTFDTAVPFGNEIVAYTADSPTGPFTSRTHVYNAPEARGNIIAYNAHVHPELSGDGRLVVSYNVNSLSVPDVYTNVANYRPRFIDVTVANG